MITRGPIADYRMWPFTKPVKQPLWVSLLAVPVFIGGVSFILINQFLDWLKK